MNLIELVLHLLAFSFVASAPTLYNEHQEGNTNVRIKLDDIALVLIPTKELVDVGISFLGKSDGRSLPERLFRLFGRSTTNINDEEGQEDVQEGNKPEELNKQETDQVVKDQIKEEVEQLKKEDFKVQNNGVIIEEVLKKKDEVEKKDNIKNETSEEKVHEAHKNVEDLKKPVDRKKTIDENEKKKDKDDEDAKKKVTEQKKNKNDHEKIKEKDELVSKKNIMDSKKNKDENEKKVEEDLKKKLEESKKKVKDQGITKKIEEIEKVSTEDGKKTTRMTQIGELSLIQSGIEECGPDGHRNSQGICVFTLKASK